MRYCCAILKEGGGEGCAVITGVRRDESRKRAAYMPVQRRRRTKSGAETKDLDQMEAANFECVSGKDKFMIYPILDWTEADVWAFLAERNLPRNPCYDNGHRVGCMFCPFASKKQKDYYTNRYPKFHTTLIAHLQRYLDKQDPSRRNFTTAEEYFAWWKSKENINTYRAKKRQLNINFDEMKSSKKGDML